MMQAILTRYYQFIEHCRQEGFLSALKLTMYKCEEILPVEKDLAALKTIKHNFDETQYEIIELNKETLGKLKLTYAFKSRREKVQQYLGNGYKSFVIIKDDLVIGDVWYVTTKSSCLKSVHPRLKWFNIELEEDEAFLFDLFVVPDERGKAITTYFFSNVLKLLKDRGCRKVFGDYVAGNIPAMWLHRTLGYREMPGILLKRYFLFESATPTASGVYQPSARVR